MNEMTRIIPADWATDQEVRWCPVCGDMQILKAVQPMPDSAPRRKTRVFVSGIGCSSRFPYHGDVRLDPRPGAGATGVKLANPELDVVDHHRATASGLTHRWQDMLHLLRRNLDLRCR